MKHDREKTFKVDREISKLFVDMELTRADRHFVVGGLVMDLGYMELGEQIRKMVPHTKLECCKSKTE